MIEWQRHRGWFSRMYLKTSERSGQITVLAIWAVALIAGQYAMSSFGYTRGATGDVPAVWPEQSLLSRQSGLPTLLLFAHPRCPCTTASLEQLKSIQTDSKVPFNCRVIFLVPENAGHDWTSSNIVCQAKAIPSVDVVMDHGEEIRRFGVSTSGHVLLYSADGQLQFNGGITIARGHVGENAGTRSVVQHLKRQSTNLSQSPTFGCPLFPKSDLCQERASCPN